MYRQETPKSKTKCITKGNTKQTKLSNRRIERKNVPKKLYTKHYFEVVFREV